MSFGRQPERYNLVKVNAPFSPKYLKNYPGVRDLLNGLLIGFAAFSFIVFILAIISIIALSYGAPLTLAPAAIALATSIGTTLGLTGSAATILGIGLIPSIIMTGFALVAGAVGKLTRLGFFDWFSKNPEHPRPVPTQTVRSRSNRSTSKVTTALQVERGSVPKENILHYVKSRLAPSEAIDEESASVEETMYTPTLIHAASIGDFKSVRLLLPHLNSEEVNAATSMGSTALYAAVIEGHHEVVTLLLTHSHINVNQSNEHGMTPLMRAAEQGDLTMVNAFLTHPHIDVNCKQQDNGTAIFIAAQNGHIEVVKLLMQKKAMIIPLRSTVETLQRFAQNFNVEEEMRNFITQKAPEDDGMVSITPQEIAAIMGHTQIVELFDQCSDPRPNPRVIK